MDILNNILTRFPYTEKEVEKNPPLENAMVDSTGNMERYAEDSTGKAYWICLCTNVFPIYARLQEYKEGVCSFAKGLCYSSSYIDNYEKECKKVIWGIGAIISYFGRVNDITNSLNIEIGGKSIAKQELFRIYYDYVFTFLYEQEKQENGHTMREMYEAYTFEGMTDKANRCIEQCKQRVIEHDKLCKERTIQEGTDMDRLFFTGKLYPIIDEFILYAEECAQDRHTPVEATMYHKEGEKSIQGKGEAQKGQIGRKADTIVISHHEEEIIQYVKNYYNTHNPPKGKDAVILFKVLTDTRIKAIEKDTSKAGFKRWLESITNCKWGNDVGVYQEYSRIESIIDTICKELKKIGITPSC